MLGDEATGAGQLQSEVKVKAKVEPEHWGEPVLEAGETAVAVAGLEVEFELAAGTESAGSSEPVAVASASAEVGVGVVEKPEAGFAVAEE